MKATVRRHRRTLALAVFLACAGLAMPSATAYSEHGCTRSTFSNEAGAREYLLCVPKRLSPDRGLVVYLPGAGQTADQAAIDTRWSEVGDRLGFVTLYPEPSRQEGGYFHYNDAADQHRGSGVPAIVAGMARKAIADLRLDPRHVYAAGMSNGGAMANVMLTTYPDLFAALLSHSGAVYTCSGGAIIGCPSPSADGAARAMHKEMGPHARVVPFLVFQGGNDSVVPPAESQRIVDSWLQADDLADDGKANHSIRSTPIATRRGQVANGGHPYTVTYYADNRGCWLGSSWLVEGMRHAYSGGAPSTAPGLGVDPTSPQVVSDSATDAAGPDATSEAVRFFSAHPSSSGDCLRPWTSRGSAQ